MVFKQTCFFLCTQRLEIISTISIFILIFSQVGKCSFEIDEVDGDICPGEGFFPDPHSCTKFYRCVETFQFMYAYEFQCPERTVFDPKVKVCNHPYAVNPSYRCFKSNLYDYKITHIIHILNDTRLHQFVTSKEIEIEDDK